MPLLRVEWIDVRVIGRQFIPNGTFLLQILPKTSLTTLFRSFLKATDAIITASIDDMGIKSLKPLIKY